ncbi:MAG TPA: methyltransferase domain-containing protein [Thermoanaerobaculia bacterium]
MGTKHDELTEEEIQQYSLRPEILAALKDCCNWFGVSPSALRILDFGCGRGVAVAKLLEFGFGAYGVDVDTEPLGNGYRALRERGFLPEQRLRLVAGDGRTPFDDGFFHLIVSDQVLEHVRDLGLVAREMSRLTTSGGRGLHFFPARRCVVEPHLFLPFLHWLPKNRLRYLYLRAVLSRLPVWQELRDASPRERATAYFKYCLEKTFYRSNRSIARIFETSGFRISFGQTETFSLQSLRRRLHRMFREVRLETRR